MSRVVVRMNSVAIRSMLRSPAGPVGRKLIAQGKEIEKLAKAKAAKHGKMKDYVHSTVLPTVFGTTVLVYCDHPAAVFVLKGTVKHDIPFNKPQSLLFSVGWRRVKLIKHPGYQGDDFLTRAMEEARL